MESGGRRNWLDRNRELAGRESEPWARRIGLALILALVVAALLNVFGQRSDSTSAAGPGATLNLKAPSRIRGGDIFQGRFQARAIREVKQPLLVLDPGWIDGLTQNSSVPQAKEERSDNGKIVLTYDTIPAGKKLVVWLQYQVNPTHVGTTKQDAELWDGTKRLVHLDHSLTTFP